MSVKILYLEIVIRDLRVLIRFATNNFYKSWKGEQINEAFVNVVKLQISKLFQPKEACVEQTVR